MADLVKHFNDLKCNDFKDYSLAKLTPEFFSAAGALAVVKSIAIASRAASNKSAPAAPPAAASAAATAEAKAAEAKANAADAKAKANEAKSSLAPSVLRPIVELLLSEGFNVRGYHVYFEKCPRFMRDFRIMIDLYGASVDASNWRGSLLTLLQAEEKFSAGDRVLTVAGAWAVTIAYTYQFPAAVAHHVESPIVSVNPNLTGATMDHYCRYFYFLGLIATEYNKFEEACTLFETAIEVRKPSRFPFAVASNKALLIVSAAARSEVAATISMDSDVPTMMAGVPSSSTNSTVETFGKYTAFASQYLTASALNPSLSKDFAKDTVGLARAAEIVLGDRAAQQVLSLTRVYVNMPLVEVAKAIGQSAENARAVIDSLIATGRIGAVVDASTGFVHFSEMSHASREGVEESINRAISLADALEAVRTRVETSADFIRSTPAFKERLSKEVSLAIAH